MGRVPCCSQVSLQRGPWKAKEDNLLTRYIEWHGEGDWRNLPGKAGLQRCGKSCRLRWLNYLRPTIKRGNISPEEEDLIIRLHRLLGNRWTLVAGRLPGRTDNEIKNYWNSHLSKKLRKRGIDPSTHKPLESNNIGDDYAPENSKAVNLDRDGKVQIGKNHENQAKESLCTESHQYVTTLSTQQLVHLPKVKRYISFSLGVDSNNDDSEGMDSHIYKKSMQETMDDLRDILDEPMGLHTPSNELDSHYWGMSFKSGPWPESNSCDSVLKMQSPLSAGMELLNEPQHEYPFCNLEGGSEFMIQNVFQDYSSLILECDNIDPGKLSLSDKTTPNPNSSNLEEYGLGYEFQDAQFGLPVQWKDGCRKIY